MLLSTHPGPPQVGRLNWNSLKASHRFLSAVATLILCCGNIQASNVQGTILGIFSNPILAGSIANSPSLGQLTYMDNTGTAIYGIVNATDPAVSNASVLVWGASSGNSGPGTFSDLIFFGNAIPADLTLPFELGTITFANGTSDLNSLIFGATLSFYANSASPETFLGSDQVIITTTSNIAGAQPVDNDYINICGDSSNICTSSIEAVESTEGGSGITVNLSGRIVGDPVLFLDSVSLASGQTAAENGVIGNSPAVGEDTPEPGTWMMLTGALALGFGMIRRRALVS
jgi:PEP-CTERM motif-containing protein